MKKNKLLVLLIPALFAVGCGENNSGNDYNLPENGKDMAFTDAKAKFSNTLKEMDSTDALGVKIEDAAIKLNVKTFKNKNLQTNANVELSDFDLFFGVKGLTSATKFSEFEASASTGIKGNLTIENTNDSSANINKTLDVSAAAYIKDGNAYVDASNENLIALLKDMANITLENTKFYVPVPADDEATSYPLLKDGMLESTFDKVYTKITSSIPTTTFNDITTTFMTCKSYNDKEWGIQLSADKEGILSYARKTIEDSMSNLGDMMTSEQKTSAIESGMQQVEEMLTKSNFDHVNAGIIFNDKQLKTIFVDVKAGAYVSEENSDGDTTTSNETNVNFEVKTYVNFLYGNDVQMNFPSFDDYKVLTTQK